ncbi:MAG: hypothetical protein Q7K39_04650 [Candidatus Magasanikbacteria bacterium]|nr:hypothetical protein [Candidatus Magasanikbacteria bacterium]
MALTEPEQIKTILKDHQYLLVLFSPHDTGDALASALALKYYAEKIGKHVDIVANGFNVPKAFKFLPGADKVKPALTEIQKFIIKVDISKTPVENLSYDIKDGWLSIYLNPKSGVITKNELRTAQSNFKYDLIITLGVTDLASLGEVFFNNTDLFYRLPIINIDRGASNERFGAINLLRLNTSSLSEIVFTLLKEIDEHLINDQLATILLTGMIAATKSFTTREVTPMALRLASELVDSGADREKIITHLYRTRSVATLKLWGAALARLGHEGGDGIVYTHLTREDFSRSGADATATIGIIEELLSNAPEAKIMVLLYELPNADKPTVRVILATNKNYNALNLAASFNPTGTPSQAAFSLENKTIGEAEQAVLNTLREQK